MRDAIGGVVTINLILVFIAIVSGYLALSVNYTKAVHVKDFIINKLEEYEGIDPKSSTFKEKVESQIRSYTTQVGYTGIPAGSIDISKDCEKENGSDLLNMNNSFATDQYVLCAYNGSPKNKYLDDGDSKRVCRMYYKVVTYINTDLPVIGQIMGSLQFFHVTGETRLLEISGTTCS